MTDDAGIQATPPSPPPPPPPPSPARLRRSRTDKVIAGVCGGMGRSLGIDPVWLRIAFVALTLAGGSGILIYIIAWIAIPEETDTEPVTPASHSGGGTTPAVIIGAVLIAIGAIYLLNTVVPWMGRVIWPLIVIAIGVAIVMGGMRNDRRN
jgi:phage shock protein C